ncbi:neural proliferation differentiation and control protein 1 isoform X2 [Gymnodraco acuticeps]|uniref:Neural proliferation differentiation and control protein 1 isoform X2 n=1 Tax=Gymnodraco acuticeps TaxID=8218 RepID=A0A6P8UCX9_GYMAC|nr:neural proliferation differentiation and control protein 1 isoform X2 [Gymnodraco acuticeps]
MGNDPRRPSSSASSVAPCPGSGPGALPGMRTLLPRAAVLAALLALSSCLTGSHLCPRSLDCARAGRGFCPPGGSHCGPCLRPLLENAHGRCVVERRHAAHNTKGKVSTYPELDEEINFLSAIISEQRTLSRLPAFTTEQPRSQSVLPTSAAPTFPISETTSSTNHTTALLSDPIILPYPPHDQVFIILCSVFMVVASMALITAGACWLRMQKGVSLTQKADYPAYRLMRAQAFDNLPGDRKLAHSAQMYHYQHQKQQMLSMEKHRDELKIPDSGASTDEENEDGDFTVYECPGLAPTGEMEVKNPLFDDSTLYLQRIHKST